MRAKFLTLVAIIVMTVGIPNAFAILNIYTDANPYIQIGYDINTTPSGRVQYTIYHEAGSNQALNLFALRFDTSVFASFWVESAFLDGATSVSFAQVGDQLIASGFNMAPGSSILLTVNYSFLGNAGASALIWPEGGIWSQSFAGLSYSGSFGIDGGSTGLTPEPGTIVLLGSGLLSLGLVRRYLQRPKKAINSFPTLINKRAG